MEIPLGRVLTSGCFSHSRSHIHMIATLDGKELLKPCVREATSFRAEHFPSNAK